MCFRYFWYPLTRQVHSLKSQQKRMTRVKPKITRVYSDDAVAPSSISNSFRYHHAQKQQLEKQLFWHGKGCTVLTVCADISEWFPLSLISLEGIPKHPQVQSLLSWVASMHWKVPKNVWAVPGVLLNERNLFIKELLQLLFWWEMCEGMNESGHWWTNTLTEFVSVSKGGACIQTWPCDFHFPLTWENFIWEFCRSGEKSFGGQMRTGCVKNIWSEISWGIGKVSVQGLNCFIIRSLWLR